MLKDYNNEGRFFIACLVHALGLCSVLFHIHKYFSIVFESQQL